MDSVKNKITTGDYKNSDIILKGIDTDEPVLICKSFFSKKEIPMDTTTIKSFTHSFLSNMEHEIIIEWKDGKLSQAVIGNAVYAAISAKMNLK